MAYTKTVWVEPQGDHLNRFKKQNETETSVELVHDPVITNQPVPVSVEGLNKLEQGVWEAHEALDNMPFGYLVPFQFEPSILELATWRCLPLGGQLVLISQYQRLCDRKYVGDAANATADWWYKCDSAGNRTTGGAYMRVLDHRGLFSRAAGQNSKYTMANDAPYDGGSTGGFKPDVTRRINTNFGSSYPIKNYIDICDTQGWEASIRVSAGKGVFSDRIYLYLSGNFGDETAGASFGAYVCIKY
jgi:hypothetical protein